MLRPRTPRVGRALSGDLDETDGNIARVATETWPPVWPSDGALPRPSTGDLGRGALGALLGALGAVGPWLAGLLAGLLARVRSSALVWPLAVGILSRIYSSILLALTPYIDPTAGIPRLLVFHNPFIQWDSQWYLTIAMTGYHAGPMQSGPFGGRHDFAFFPGWPAVLSVFQNVGISPIDVAAPLANVLFVVAALVMFVVMERQFGRSAAKWGIVLLAFSPAAYVLSMAYSEPLYLLLIAAVFALRGPLRAVVAGAVGLTRVSGVALGAAAGLRWLRNWRDWPALLTAVGAAVAFAAWWVFIWILTGDPMGWFLGSAQWSHTLGVPAIWKAITDLSTPRIGALLFVGTILACSIWLIRRNMEMGLYCVFAIGLSLVGAPVESMPRHALAAFPAFGLLAGKLGPRKALILAVIFAALEANYVLLSFAGPLPLAP